MRELVLNGCRPTPLAHYLKALGVLRLVSEQKDASARGSWHLDRFVLTTTLPQEELERFFLFEYAPTPVVGPWNGGSGFYPKDNSQALDALGASSAPRLAPYRETLHAARDLLARLEFIEKPGANEKPRLLEACRATFPDEALSWLDAAYVLTADGAKFPPLLGTGGNDGRLEFSNNFMQRLVALFDPSSGAPTPESEGLLRAALFGAPSNALTKKAPIGQFLPSNAGGANALAGFSAESLINPWDFALMLEGAVCFAASSTRRLESDSDGALSAPFTVRTSSVGYGSSAKEEDGSSRAEIWMPLWDTPAALNEITALLSEGRARVGARSARNGVDFARAVAGLGVDRGVQSFQRYGFHVRNGLSFFAVPLNRVCVRAEPRIQLVQELDSWMDTFRGKANSATAPASVQQALRRLESAVFELCQRADAPRVQNLLAMLGACEQALAKSARWTAESFVPPIPPLSPQWLSDADDGSSELRLAASLASVWGSYGSHDGGHSVRSLRDQLEPISSWRSSEQLHVRWDWNNTRDVAWQAGQLPVALNAIMARRLLLAQKSGSSCYPDRGRLAADLHDVGDFVDGHTDDAKLAHLLWGFALLDWSRVQRSHRPAPRLLPDGSPGALYALMKLCFLGPNNRPSKEEPADCVPLAPHIHRAAAAGNSTEAATQAVRRLRGSGFVPAIDTLTLGPQATRRAAAALLFPIGRAQQADLERLVLRPRAELPDSHSEPLNQTGSES